MPTRARVARGLATASMDIEVAAPARAIEPLLGPALRDVLDAEPKALRRALASRGDPARADDHDPSSKRATRARSLATSLDAIAPHLSSSVSSSSDADAHDPVIDPLLERVVRPASACGDGDGGDPSDASAKKRAALRVIAWALSPSPERVGDARVRARRVAGVLAARCAPGDRSDKRARLAACLALRRAAIDLDDVGTAFDARCDVALAATACARGAPSEGPPTRLEAEAADAFFAITARLAVAAAREEEKGGEKGERARVCGGGGGGGDGPSSAERLTAALPRLLLVTRTVREWWPASHRAPRLATREIIKRLESLSATSDDDGTREDRATYLAAAWKDFAPALAIGGGLGVIAGDDAADADPAASVARWLDAAAAATAAATAATAGGAADAATTDAVVRAFASLALLLGRLGLAAETDEDGRPSSDAAKDAAAVLRDRASAALLPALKMRSEPAQELAAASLRAALSADGAAEKAALLDGLLPLMDDDSDVAATMEPSVGAGLASTTAWLVASEPGGGVGVRRGMGTVLAACGATAALGTRRNALRVLAETLRLATPPAARPAETEAIVSALAAAVGDADACARALAADALAAIPLSASLPPLLRADAEDAAAVAMSSSARASGGSAGPARALESLLRAIAPPRDEEETEEDDDDGPAAAIEARAIALLPRWAVTVPTDAWRAVADVLAATSLARPGAAAFVRATSALSPWTGEPPACRAFFVAARGAMRAHDESRRVDASGASAPASVFERLAPLLLLRAPSPRAWDDDDRARGDGDDDGDGDARALADALLKIALATGVEHDDVRRVAAELHGRAAPRVASVARSDALREALRDADADADADADSQSASASASAADRDAALARARACMFASCAALSARGLGAIQDGGVDDLRAAAAAATRRLGDDDESAKTRTGAAETLAALTRAELAAKTRGRERGSETLRGVLAAMRRDADAPAWVASSASARAARARLALANVLVVVARAPPSDPDAAAAFVRLTLPSLASAAVGGGDNVDDAEEVDACRAAASQAAMVIVASAATATTTTAAATAAARDAVAEHAKTVAVAASRALSSGDGGEHGPRSRLAAAKLATALLASDEDALRALGESLATLRGALAVAAGTSDSKELSDVATTLLRAMGGPIDDRREDAAADARVVSQLTS